MTNNWNDGYVSDIEYVPGYYHEQSASHIETICLINGVESPVTQGNKFTYCELGCGLGDTSLITAATAPEAQIYAFDFNPAHIARAQNLAQKCGIENVHFGEKSFKQLAEGDVPENMPLFDYVTLHGIWTWINHENRAYIVEFLSHYLKPGGVVYVSYNTLPGYSSVIPMRHLFLRLANNENGSTDHRAEKAIKKILEMTENGIQYLPKDITERLSKNRSYLSHEYLNADWDPTFHSQVADAFSEAKLVYYGSANILDNYINYVLTPEQIKLLNTLPSDDFETVKDYFTNSVFRKDLFVRGKRNYSFVEATENIKNMTIQLTTTADQFNYTINIPRGRMDLNKDNYTIIIKALDENGMMRIGDILEIPEIKDKNLTPFEVCSSLLGSKQAIRVLPKENQTDLNKIKKINKTIVEENIKHHRKISALACNKIGQALNISDYEMLTYYALCNGCPEDIGSLVASITKIMNNYNMHVIKDEQIVNDESQKREVIKTQVETILSKSIPLWKKLGAY